MAIFSRVFAPFSRPSFSLVYRSRHFPYCRRNSIRCVDVTNDDPIVNAHTFLIIAVMWYVNQIMQRNESNNRWFHRYFVPFRMKTSILYWKPFHNSCRFWRIEEIQMALIMFVQKNAPGIIHLSETFILKTSRERSDYQELLTAGHDLNRLAHKPLLWD